MTPVYLNPPSSSPAFSSLVDDQTEEHQRLKLFISSSSPYKQAFFDSLEPQTGTTTTTTSSTPAHHSLLYNQKADNPTWYGGTSYDDQVCSSSSSLVDQPAAVVLDVSNDKDHKFLSISTTERDEVNLGDQESSKSKNNDNRTVKWMSSKMRLMQKMANPTDHNINAQKLPTTTSQQQQPLENSDTTSSLISNGSSCKTSTTTAVTVRVCSDCNTNTTPLWRSGPQGPKSLCNACGIRQRKARRAMVESAAAAAAAANGLAVGSGTAETSSSFMKGKVPNKEKKSRGGTGSHVAKRHKINNKSKLITTDTSISTTSHSIHHHKIHNKRNKLCFKTSFQRVFPQDVAEAAVLLMELSCGLINHSS